MAQIRKGCFVAIKRAQSALLDDFIDSLNTSASRGCDGMLVYKAFAIKHTISQGYAEAKRPQIVVIDIIMALDIDAVRE